MAPLRTGEFAAEARGAIGVDRRGHVTAPVADREQEPLVYAHAPRIDSVPRRMVSAPISNTTRDSRPGR
jgi:hypothetical protein